MLPLARLRRYAVLLGLLVIGSVGLLLVLRSPADPLDNPAYDALSKALSRRIAQDSMALRAAQVAVVHDTVRVAVAVREYRTLRDSVFIPTTRAETVAVLDRLPRLLGRADSVAASCTDLTHDTAPLLTSCEQTKINLTLDRDRWKLAAESRTPSRWDGVKSWVIRGVLVYGAFRLGQAAR